MIDLLRKLLNKPKDRNHLMVTPLYKRTVRFVPVHHEDAHLTRRGCLICGKKSGFCECIELRR